MRRRGDRLARSIAATYRDHRVAANQTVAATGRCDWLLQLVVPIDRRDDRLA